MTLARDEGRLMRLSESDVSNVNPTNDKSVFVCVVELFRYLCQPPQTPINFFSGLYFILKVLWVILVG